MKENNDMPAAGSSDSSLRQCSSQQTVTITLNGQGVPVVNHSSIDIEAGGKVTFKGPSSFEIRFPGSTPCNNKTYNTTCGELEIDIRPNACGAPPPGYTAYKYDVKVDGKVLDPEIRVHEPV